MNFIDANVFLYAVGNDPAAREQAYEVFHAAERDGRPLCTSAGALEEVCYVLWREGNGRLISAVLRLVDEFAVQVWPLEMEDVQQAIAIHDRFSSLDTMDLCQLASCLRRNATALKTFDRRLEQAAASLLA